MRSAWKVDCRRANLDELIEWCVSNHAVNRMLVAIRMRQVGKRWQADSREVETNTEKIFKGHVVKSFLASAWPSTELIGQPGRVYVIELTEEVKSAIIGTENILGNWLHNSAKSLPEDICFFRDGDESPALVSCTHEKSAYLLTEKNDVRLPFVSKSDVRWEELEIPSEENFCFRWDLKRAGRG